MINEQVSDYIEKALKSGVFDEEITKNLLSVGWKEQQIKEAFVFVKGKQNISMSESTIVQNIESGLELEDRQGEKMQTLPQENNINYWRPVMLFYVKTTSWIIIPLILCLLVVNYVGKSMGSQIVFFAVIIAGFGITCFGIYREIKSYKKSLNIPSHKEIKKE